MRSPRMAPNTFVAPAGKLVQIRPPRALFRFCLLAVDGLMAPARNAVDSETQKEIVLQVGPKNRYFPLSAVKRAARVSVKQYVGAYAGRCRFRKVRARLMVRAFSSGGSFQGNTVISAFGASEAMSIETWSGCAVTSSGSTSIGVWHDFAKSRDTLYTKSGCTR